MSEYLDGKLETEDQLHPSDKSRHHSTGVNGFAPTYASGESGDISMELAAINYILEAVIINCIPNYFKKLVHDLWLYAYLS